jgi:peroxiredoxin (alkyl hydroperoxide reductase subunit C)
MDKADHTPCACLRLGDAAPDFAARSTMGDLSLSDFRGRWLVLFSHPADFTPVCTSEFVALAQAASEFAARDCALLGLSVDSLFSHFAWLRTIRDRLGIEVRFPLIEDPTMVIGKAYGMVDPRANDSATVRSTYFIDPQGTIRAITSYPFDVGRSVPEMLRMLDALQASSSQNGLAPANWQPGEPLLESAASSIDKVYKAASESDWFYKLGKGKGTK